MSGRQPLGRLPADLEAFWALDPAVTYLNHGSFGACPRPVLDAQSELRARLERQPVRFFLREMQGHLDAARERLAALLGAAPADLALVPNATFAVSSVLASLELRAGDEILVTDHGYNACRNAAARAARLAGGRVVAAVLPVPLDDPAEVEARVLAAVGPRTRLALLDAITSPSAMVLPLERLVPALRERGVETLVDGAHACGQVPLDLEALGAAYHTGNAHKWLCAPKGAAYLHARRDRQEGLLPAVLSHGPNSPRPGRSPFHDAFDWIGTLDPTAMLVIPDALDALEGLLPGGLPALMERNRQLAGQGADLLIQRLGLCPVAPRELWGAMVTLELPEDPDPTPALDLSTTPGPVSRLQTDLWQRERLEVPLGYWPAPPRRTLRISAQAYNALEDYARLAAALEDRGLGTPSGQDA